MITVIVTGRTARAFSDDAVTVESKGIPVQFKFSDEWTSMDKVVCFASGETRFDVELTSDSCEVPAAVLTASGPLRLGVYGHGNGAAMPSTWTEVVVVKGVTKEDLAALLPDDPMEE